MLSKIPVFKNFTIAKVFAAIFVIACTLLVFCLDMITRANVAFYIFYIPSIALMAWYFGKNAGWSMVALSFGLWFVAQWNADLREDAVIMFWDGLINLTNFSVVCWIILALRSREEQLRERSQELEQFAFNAAHELRSPATNIFGYAQLFHEKCQMDSDQETKGFVEKILKNVKRMTVLIKELLDYALAGKEEVAPSSTDLGKVLKDVLDGFNLAITEKKAELTFDPLPTLLVNPVLASVLFQNLIGNALKYCEKPPRIHVSAVRKGGDWVFSVKDNGIGIPAKDWRRIFVIFEKLPTTKEYLGSGIGLATCKKIVERYHGRIWVESKVGEGSTFRFSLSAD